MLDPNDLAKGRLLTSNATDTLSDKWRTQKSQIPKIDLAHSLKAMQKVIGYVLPDAINVTFATKANATSKNNTKRIVIDPQYAMKSSPIAPEHEDVLFGLAMHEAGHSIVKTHNLTPVEVALPTGEILQLDYLGEEVYVDKFMGRTYLNAKDYIARARDAYNLPLGDYDTMRDIFIYICVYGNIPDASAMGNSPHITIIPPMMNMASRVGGKDMTVWERRKVYIDTQKEILNLLKMKQNPVQSSAPRFPSSRGRGKSSLVQNPIDNTETRGEREERVGTTPPKDQREIDIEGLPVQGREGDKPNPDPKAKGSQTPQNQDTDGQPEVSTSLDNSFHSTRFVLSEVMTSAIQDAIDNEEEELTQRVRADLEYKGDLDGKTIVYRKARTDITDDFNETLARQLAWLRELKNSVGSQFYRNEEHGRIDQRALYKAPMTGRVFKRRVTLPHKDTNVVLLLDASGSMGQKTSIYDDAAAVFRTLQNAVVLSYHDHVNEVLVYRHDEGRLLRKVQVEGKTPSGSALLAAAVKFPQSLIIHFTDGHPNSGRTVMEALSTIEKQALDVKVVNIVYGGAANNYPENNSCKTIILDDIKDFATKLKQALTTWGWGA